MWARVRRFDGFYILLFFVALILLRQFFQVDYIYGHDSLYHISSIEAIRAAFEAGQFNLDLLPTVAYGFGYGSGMFYAQFFHIAAAALSFLVGDVIFAIKIVHLVSFFLSGAVMYLLLKKVLGGFSGGATFGDLRGSGELSRTTVFADLRGSRELRGENAVLAREGSGAFGTEPLRTRIVAFLGACFYLSAPFHLADHLIRDAEAELLIFLFIPLILLGLVYLHEMVLLKRQIAAFREQNFSARAKTTLLQARKRFYFCFVVGYAGLFLSNSAIALFFTAFLAVALGIEFLIGVFRCFREESGNARGRGDGFSGAAAALHSFRGSVSSLRVSDFAKPFLIASGLVLLIVAPFYVNLLEQKSVDLVVFSETTTANNHYYLENEAATFADLFIPSVDTSYLAIPLTLNVCAVILAIYAILTHFRARASINGFRKSTSGLKKSISGLGEHFITKNASISGFGKSMSDSRKSIGGFGEHFSAKNASMSIFRLMLILAILSIFATSALFPWGAIPDLLSPLQFPWRLETILLPALTVLAAIGLYELFSLFDPRTLPFSKSRNLLPIVFMSVFALVSCAYYSTLVRHDFELKYDAASYDAAYYGLGWGHEYLPEKANFTTAGAVSSSGTPSSEMALSWRGGEVIVENGAATSFDPESEATDSSNSASDAATDSSAVAVIAKNEALVLEATITGANFPTTIELPRLYYLGYEIELTDASGATMALDYHESARGMVEVEVPSAGTVRANYRGTTAVRAAKIVSGVAVLGFVAYLVIPPRGQKRRRQ